MWLNTHISVIDVYDHVVVHFAATVMTHILPPNNGWKAKWVWEDFCKDRFSWNQYNMSYTNYMQHIIDELCLIQDNLIENYNYIDIALVADTCDTNNTNINTNFVQDCTTEDDLDFSM